MNVELRTLGPVEISESGAAIDVGGPRQRRLLAALAVRANTAVSTDALIDIVFDGEPPGGAPTTIRSYIARLRKALKSTPDAEIVRGADGYELQVDPANIDATRFVDLATRGRRSIEASAPVDAADMLRAALDLWRGAAYGDFASEDWARGEATRLEELRVDTEELFIEARLACGQADDVLPDLRRLIDAHPLRERLRGQLMLALFRTGRQAEALREFESFRAELIEVGLEPTDALVSLERSIAAHDPALQLSAPAGRALRGYRLGRSLGVGRQGEVFRAVQPVIGREVAIKVIRPEVADEPAFIRRFDAEVQAISKLEHAHVVPVYDYWREPSAAYIVMRSMPTNLAEVLERGPLEIDDAVRLIRHLGSALAAAHRAGLVHSDIRPSNVMMDHDGNFFLSDFAPSGQLGVVGAYGRNTEPTGHESPEIRSGHAPSPATDQFGLAVLVACALSGLLPFGRRGVMSAADRLAPLSGQRPSVPADVDHVLWRAASWDPNDRYPDMTTFTNELLAALSGERPPTTLPAPVNPYRGLEAFTESDRDWFFGRDDVVDRVIERLASTSPSSMVTLIGASGSGKSSVVRAGVVPRLRAGALAGSADWFFVTMSPGERPLDDLETALRSIASDRGHPPTSPARSVAGLIADAVEPDQTVVLVIDQLEELYTLAPANLRDEFVEGLVEAVTRPASRLRILATMRADFLDRPLHHSRFGRMVTDGAVTVAGMSAEQLDRAIREPAKRSGVDLEPALVSELIADLVDQPAALPLLQFTLTELFERRSGNAMTLDAYRRLGGVEAAVAGRADEVFEQLSPDDQRRARRLFLRLVTLDDSGRATRRRVLRAELDSINGAGDAAELTGRFGAVRLLAFDRDAVTREPTVEIAHESLATHWPRFAAWVVDAGEGLRIRSRLTVAAAQWEASGRDRTELYRGGRLDAALAWAEDQADSTTRLESEFLAAGVQQRDEDEHARRGYVEQLARSNRRLRVTLVVVALALVLAILAGVFAFRQRSDGGAADQLRTAETGRSEAIVAPT